MECPFRKAAAIHLENDLIHHVLIAYHQRQHLLVILLTEIYEEETMELLQKFSAVEIQANHRITEMDKDYCERHQKAYEAAISSFQELAF